jgi:hypothetical protein
MSGDNVHSLWPTLVSVNVSYGHLENGCDGFVIEEHHNDNVLHYFPGVLT